MIGTIYSEIDWEIYTPYADATGCFFLHINGKFTMGILMSSSFVLSPCYQVRGIVQCNKQTCLYMWYPLFQSSWGRCDQQNHKT